MDSKEFKERAYTFLLSGCPLFFVFTYIPYKKKKKITHAFPFIYILCIQFFLTSHLTVLGFWFGVTFGIAKHCFNKDNTEALKIAGIVTGALFGALLTFFIADLSVRKIKENDYADQAVKDLFLVEALICLPATALGFVQISVYEALTSDRYKYV